MTQAKVRFTTACLLSFAFVAGGAALGQEYWVSTTGNDAETGTKEKPFATLERARGAVRKVKKDDRSKWGVTVWLRGGVYRMDKTLDLGVQDAGTAEAPVVYRSAPGEEARLAGGTQIPSSAFKPVTDDETLKRLDPTVHGKVMQADLKALGITDYGALTRRGGIERDILPAGLELFFNDRPMQPARWPNKGWSKIASVPEDGIKGSRFSYEGDRPKRWRKAEDIWVHGYFNRNWCDTYEKIAAIDTATREIITAEPHDYRGYKAGQRILFLNVLEELDEPGEWYLDRNTGILYFWPPEPIENGRVLVSVLETPLVTLHGTEHVTLRGLILECTRNSAVEMVGGHHNLVAGCTIRNIGTVAVSIGGAPMEVCRRGNPPTFTGNAGMDNGVLSCEIYDTGDQAIILFGGDRKTLEPGRNYAVNNDIYKFGRWVRTCRPAVSLYGVGNRVAHNLMHDAPHTAVLFWGNDHVLEFNEVYRVCTDTGDAGAFYIGRDWTQRGNVVRYNYFHDLGASLAAESGWNAIMGVYLDDMACGTTVFGNIFCRINRAMLVGGGRDNNVENNIFVDCPLAISLDARGFYGSADTLFARLKAVNHDRPPYSTRYPALSRILDGNPELPVGNVIVRNISVRSDFLPLGHIPEEIQKLVTIKDNLTEGDPGLVAPEKGDFGLREDSPALKLGFKPIPLDKIGLYRDEYR